MQTGDGAGTADTAGTRNRTTPKDRQCTNDVLMIRPTAFGSNEVTRPTNRFQAAVTDADPALIARAAVAEFNALVAALVARGVNVHMFAGKTSAQLPDEVFPNNWISTHDDGTVVLYPLLAWNRREERRRDIVDELQQPTLGFRISRVVDLSVLESHGHYLEGTGSVVLDRTGRTLFACRSARTHTEVLHVFAKKMQYPAVTFEARDLFGQPVYHTNVMMTVGDRFAVVCVEAITEVSDRYRVVRRLEERGREVIRISREQMHAFAGNILELQGRDGRIIVMSTTAVQALTEGQKERLQRHGELVTANVRTIERFGGGSVRCMLAEIFLPRRQATPSG